LRLEVGGRKDRRLEGEKIKLWIADYELKYKRGKTSVPNHPNETNHLNVLNDHKTIQTKDRGQGI
jgi:hypothetical protein